MMDWDKLRIFHTVAAAESFTRAGEQLNLSQSAISRQIATLEESLGVSLFHRHARGLLLTEQGEILFRTATDMVNRLSAAENQLHDSRERPRGPLKIAAPTALGTMWLTPHMKEFCELYPDIEVTLVVDDREKDLLKREADVAIGFFPARHGDMVQKKLTTLNNSLYASNGYLKQHGTPRTPQDLCSHRLIAYGGTERLPFGQINWALKAGRSGKPCCTPFFTISSMRGMVKAVEAGIGMAGLPDYMVQGEPDIRKILPELKGPLTEVYFTYPMELRNSKRVRAFKEFLARKFVEDRLSQAA